MTRNILAAVLALALAFSAVAAAQQGARASRWQPDQFGPIVTTDTMWSIAGYYSRQQGIPLHQMMDRIVAANPRAFRDNRPDFMLTGFYLEIPQVGERAPAETSAVTAPSSSAATESREAENTEAENTDVVDTSVESEIAISVTELQALRTQLSDSIGLIENLQGENTELQERLAAVTQELNELRARADAEQQASTEMELMAQELSNDEVTTDTIAAEPETSSPATEQPENVAEPEESEGASATTESVASVTAENADPQATSAEAATQPEAKPAAVSKRKQTSWLDWLLTPLHLIIVGGVLILLLAGLAYALYVRRINREIEETGAPAPTTDDDTQVREDDTDALAAASEVDEEEAAASDELSQAEAATSRDEDWQERDVDDNYVEVTDVDLDEYLRERSDTDSVEDTSDDNTFTDLDDDDPMSKEVDALLAMDFPEHDDEPEAEAEEGSKADEAAEDVAEFRVPEPPSEDEAEASKEADDRHRDELDQALDSFGGLRLDDDEANEVAGKPETSDKPSEKPEGADDDADYLSIESLMEEAETEASEEHEDPYDKEKLNEALGGDDNGSNEIDLSTEAMLDESKSPAAKLDLAQVYIDMGEIDDARSLLESIQGCGDEEAERDAAELLDKLSEQGGR